MKIIPIVFTARLNTSVDCSFEFLVDQMAEHLAGTDVTDPTLFLDLGKHSLEIRLSVQAPSELEAFEKALDAIRIAIHAAWGKTPGWESAFEVQGVSRDRQLTAQETK